MTAKRKTWASEDRTVSVTMRDPVDVVFHKRENPANEAKDEDEIPPKSCPELADALRSRTESLPE